MRGSILFWWIWIHTGELNSPSICCQVWSLMFCSSCEDSWGEMSFMGLNFIFNFGSQILFDGSHSVSHLGLNIIFESEDRSYWGVYDKVVGLIWPIVRFRMWLPISESIGIILNVLTEWVLAMWIVFFVLFFLIYFFLFFLLCGIWFLLPDANKLGPTGDLPLYARLGLLDWFPPLFLGFPLGNTLVPWLIYHLLVALWCSSFWFLLKPGHGVFPYLIPHGKS